MKRYVIQLVIMLCINILLECMAGYVFYLAWFQRDPLLAIVPAVVAFVGFIVQPWFFFFLFLPFGFFYAPVLATLLSMYVYRTPERHEEILDAVFAWFKRPRRALIVSAAVMLGLAFYGMRYVDFPAMRHGVPQRLEGALAAGKITLPDGRLHCLRSFMDSEWIYLAEVEPSLLDAAVKKLKMESFPMEDVPYKFFHQRPYWWHPEIEKQSVAFATEDFSFDSRGRDGLHAFMLWNPETHILHVWVKDNF